MYELRPVVDGYVEQMLDKSGKNSTTVLNAKRRSENARAEKLELWNRKEKGELVPAAEIEAAQSELLAILSRGLDGLSLRLKKRYPETPTKYISAIDNFVAQLRNDSIEGIAQLAEKDSQMNAEQVARQQLENELLAEQEDADAEAAADAALQSPQDAADLRTVARNPDPPDEFGDDW